MSDKVTVVVLPDCDICKDNGPQTPPKPAAYDGKTVWGPWANMCQEHWTLYGVGQLGTGYGQRLVLKGSV